jgi:hypothetical protein
VYLVINKSITLNLDLYLYYQITSTQTRGEARDIELVVCFGKMMKGEFDGYTLCTVHQSKADETVFRIKSMIDGAIGMGRNLIDISQDLTIMHNNGFDV